MERASDLSTVYKALLQKPLEIEDLEEFYIDTHEARGDRTRSMVARILNNNIGVNNHILFVGYKGCGKSTELKHLEKDIQDRFLVINYSVLRELDPNNISCIELIIVTMQKLFDLVEKKKLGLSELYINNITEYLNTKEITEIRDKYMGAEIKAGAMAKIDIPFLSQFFTAFTASARSSRSLKEILKKNVEPHFSTLLNHCNDLIKEVRLKLGDLGKEDLVVIIEDLDKINITQAEDLFFSHSNQLTLLLCNVIYTFPIALKYNSRFNTIGGYFANSYELPMIMVHDKKGEAVEKGVETMKAIVGARMELGLFSEIHILERFIQNSGGCLRDLFKLISDASENADIEERDTIREEDQTYAYNKLKRDYRSTIADLLDSDGKVAIPVAVLYEALNRLNDNPHKTIDNTREELILRQNLTILGYNGEGWCDVHPMVKDILQERNGSPAGA